MAGSENTPLIRLRDVYRIYEMGDQVLHALDGVTLDIGQNEYVAVVGASGSGKSTLMNILGCLDRATRGDYVLNGTDVSDMNETRLAAVRNREIGFVFQSFNLLSRASALKNVMQPLVYRGMPRAERKQVASEALNRVGLGDRLESRPNQLSGGQRQRVAIARALVGEPSILLADEPTGNLDPDLSREIMGLFELFNRVGVSVLIASHDISLIGQLDYPVITLEHGRLAATAVADA